MKFIRLIWWCPWNNLEMWIIFPKFHNQITFWARVHLCDLPASISLKLLERPTQPMPDICLMCDRVDINLSNQQSAGFSHNFEPSSRNLHQFSFSEYFPPFYSPYIYMVVKVRTLMQSLWFSEQKTGWM